MARIPFACRGEYRGVAPAGQFVNNEGEKVEFGPKLKFEVDLPDGDIETLILRQTNLDQVADFNVAEMKKGDQVHIEGVVSYGGDYVSIRALSVRKAAGPVVAKAA